MALAVSEKAMREAMSDFFRGSTPRRKGNTMMIEEPRNNAQGNPWSDEELE